jgi:glycosyltransferase 2 family protein
MKNKKLKFALNLAVSIGFIAWIIFRVDWREVFAYVLEIKIWQAAAFMAVYLCGILISAIKWKMLADYKNIKTSVKECFKYYLAGTFINNFFPSFVGGDTFKSYRLGKSNGGKYAEAASTVLIDRITGFIAVMLMVFFFSAVNYRIVLENPILVAVNILILLSFGSDVLIIAAKKIKFLRRVASRAPKILLRIYQEVKSYSRDGKVIKKAVLMGILFNLVGVAAANYILLASLGVSINITQYLMAIFAISIVSAIPISINNIGIKEWAYITFFGIFGVGSSVVVTVAILSRFLMMLVSFAAIPAYLKDKNYFLNRKSA